MANMAQAVRMALHYGETHLGVTDVLGEDVGPPLGGVFTATQGLKTAWNTPLDERGIIGTPIVDVSAKFLRPASYGDELVIHTSVSQWRSRSFKSSKLSDTPRA